ncbi:MAG: hypothetical protein ACRD06_01240 [Terriglobia bacterium]
MRTPEGGIQPQGVVDQRGTLHLIYFKGDNSAAGDAFYVQRGPGSAVFSKPLRINSHPGSVMAMGSVRGAQVAIGKNERVHVAWLGSAKAAPRGPNSATPMLYARMNDAGTAFEPQRNVMQYATGLDGGGSVAADSFGNVYVAWHANPQANGEADRRVYLACSTDDGNSFAREKPAYGERTGACGCCGMRAFANQRGALFILYRTATKLIHRDMELLVSHDRGIKFTGQRIAKWTLNACPMSTDWISQGGHDVLAAWETAGQVYYDEISPATPGISRSVAAPGGAGDRKHPAVAANANGETLLAWTEGTAWERGGSVAWQLFDNAGRPLHLAGRADGLPVWGLVAAFARPDGGFMVFY